MKDGHVEEAEFRRMLSGEAGREERRAIVRHLLHNCPQCLELVKGLTVGAGFFTGDLPPELGIEDEQGPLGLDSYDQAFARILALADPAETARATERLLGLGQFAYLDRLTREERFDLVRSDPRFHNRGLFDTLLESYRVLSFRSPQGAVSAASLALVVVEHLDSAAWSEAALADLRADAWGAIGNAKRLASDFSGADEAFREAWRNIEQGTGKDLLKRAELISLEASFLRNLGEFEAAAASLEQAMAIYIEVGDRHLQGRTLVQMGTSIGPVDPVAGVQLLRRALLFIEPLREPRLELCLQHALAWFLNDAGNSRDALAVLDAARGLYRQFPDSYTRLRFNWLEGRIAHRLGHLDEAENVFRMLWEQFQARELHHELVLVSIDLAEVYFADNQLDRAAKLAGQVLGVMRGWKLHREAQGVWLLFRKTLDKQKVAANTFRELAEYFQRSWHLPARAK